MAKANKKNKGDKGDKADDSNTKDYTKDWKIRKMGERAKEEEKEGNVRAKGERQQQPVGRELAGREITWNRQQQQVIHSTAPPGSQNKITQAMHNILISPAKGGLARSERTEEIGGASVSAGIGSGKETASGRRIKMHAQNPFVPWDDRLEALAGRKNEWKMLTAVLQGTISGQAAAVMVHGGPGSGKTGLLKQLQKEAERHQIAVLQIKVEHLETAGNAIVKLWQEATLKGFLEEQDSKPTAAARQNDKPVNLSDLVARLMQRVPAGPHFGASQLPQSQTITQPTNTQPANPGASGVLIIIDDLDMLRKPEELLIQIEELVANWQEKHMGHGAVGIIATCTKELGNPGHIGRVSTVNLQPLSEQEANEFITRTFRNSTVKMGEECLNAIRSDTNGNPYLFRVACWQAYDALKENETVISRRHYSSRLPAILSMLSREWFGRMYNETPAAERRILEALAKNDRGEHVSEVAKSLGKPIGQVTVLVRRLLDKGQIIKVDRGKYRTLAGLYSRYILRMIQ